VTDKINENVTENATEEANDISKASSRWLDIADSSSDANSRTHAEETQEIESLSSANFVTTATIGKEVNAFTTLIITGVLNHLKSNQLWGYIRPRSPEMLPSLLQTALQANRLIPFRVTDININDRFPTFSEPSTTFTIGISNSRAQACDASLT